MISLGKIAVRRNSLGSVGGVFVDKTSSALGGKTKKVLVKRTLYYHPGQWRHVSHGDPSEWSCCYNRFRDAKGCKPRPQLPPAVLIHLFICSVFFHNQ